MPSLSAIFAICLLLTSGVAVAASPAAFRGLDGQSRIKDVLNIFPTARSKNKCSAGEVEQKSADGSTACEIFAVEAYKLNDTHFDLSFMFNLDGTLRYVSILKVMGSPVGADRGVERSAIVRLFLMMIEPLSARFGASVVDMPGATYHSKYEVGEIEWQPGKGTAWRSGVDRVKLSANAVERSNWPNTYSGSVHIFYSFIRSADVSKL